VKRFHFSEVDKQAGKETLNGEGVKECNNRVLSEISIPGQKVKRFHFLRLRSWVRIRMY